MLFKHNGVQGALDTEHINQSTVLSIVAFEAGG